VGQLSIALDIIHYLFNNVRFISLIPLIILASTLGSVLPVYGDTGTSNNLFYRHKIDDVKYFVGRANLATRNGLSDLFFGYADVNIGFKLNPEWSAQVGYRQAALKLGSTTRQEYRPMADLTYREKWGSWRFSNRNRIEFRYFEGNTEEHIRYRNESVWTAPYKSSKLKLTPYIAEEFFYEFTDNHFNVNWLTFGVRRKFSGNKSFKLGYRWQALKFSGEWTDRHTLVTGIAFFN
jgi:hypothetical protein